jgi:hypothetical protein
MDYQTYATRKDAVKAIENMSGWNAKPSQLFIPDDENANKNGNVWVIEITIASHAQPQYMRSDGYVR